MCAKPFNLSKQARHDPPTAFDLLSPDMLDPYRLRAGKPGEGNPVDKLRAGNVPSAINSTPGGTGFSDNKEWPSDTPLFTDFEGRDVHEFGSLVTDYGMQLHDDYEGQRGDSGESILGINNSVAAMVDGNDRDRKPFNINQYKNMNVLVEIRNRIRNI
jgi:hypothetical protein